MRYFLDIRYNGTCYHGWQIQPNGITVQQELEEALTQILRNPTPITGSGRTDTGVHAMHQVAHFDSADKLDCAQLAYQLNSYLGRDIAINKIQVVKADAHARFDATSRTYHYHLHTKKDPFRYGKSYYYTRPLDLEIIAEACKILQNWQNFECFSKVHTEVNHFNCDLMQATWREDGDDHLFIIQANRFLRGMVRAVVGTLLDVGRHKTSLKKFEDILRSGDRSKAGRAVPPDGLYLQSVTYPETLYIDPTT